MQCEIDEGAGVGLAERGADAVALSNYPAFCGARGYADLADLEADVMPIFEKKRIRPGWTRNARLMKIGQKLIVTWKGVRGSCEVDCRTSRECCDYTSGNDIPHRRGHAAYLCS